MVFSIEHFYFIEINIEDTASILGFIIFHNDFMRKTGKKWSNSLHLRDFIKNQKRTLNKLSYEGS